MIKLRFSKRTLRTILLILLFPSVLIGLYRLGVAVTPLDSDGRPMILAPSLHAARRYLDRARSWIEDLAEVDAELDALLETNSETAEELYAQNQQMQQVGEQITRLAQRVSLAETPVALVGLRDRLVAATVAYQEAALSTARCLNAPTEEGYRDASAALREARLRLDRLQESQWLTN